MPVYSKRSTSHSSQQSQSNYSSSVQSSFPRYSNPRQPYPTPNINHNANLPYPSTGSYNMPQPGNSGLYAPNSASSISYPSNPPYPSYPSPRVDANPSNEQIMYQSLLTSVEEKLNRRLHEVVEEGKTEIESQRHIENELKKSSTILEDKVKRLKEEEV